jgi:sugar phosphate permease
LFHAPDLWITFAYVFCTYGSITYYLFRMPVWLADNDVKVASVGMVLTVLWLTFSGVSTLLRNFVDGPHILKIMLAAPLLIAAAVPILSYGDNIWLLVLSAAFVGSGLACSNAPSTQLVLRFAPQGMRAVSTSLDITFARLGGIATVAFLAQATLTVAATVVTVLSLLAVCCTLKVCRYPAEDISAQN